MRVLLFWVLSTIVISFILVVFVYGGASSSSSSSNSSSQNSIISPLTPTEKRGTEIRVAPDGKVYFMELGSSKVLWSFSSGPSIYSSYQRLPAAGGENFHVDLGKDSKLYLHVTGQKEVALPFSPDELWQRTPYVFTGGGVMMGSKKTSVFRVDAKTGKVVSSIRSDSFPSVGEQGAYETSILKRKDAEKWLPSTPTEVEDVKNPLYIIRTDYALMFTSEKTGEVLWYLMFADVEAFFQCQGSENLFRGFSHDKLEANSQLQLPNHCQTPPVVHVIRDWSPSEPEGSALPLLAPGHNPIKPVTNSLRPYHDNENDNVLALRTSVAEEFAARILPRGGPPQISRDVESEISAHPHSWLAILYDALPPVVIALFLYVGNAFFRKQGKPFKQSEDLKLQSSTMKKRKGRKSAVSKQRNLVGIQSGNVSPNDAVRSSDESENAEMTNAFLSPNFFDSNNSYGDGRRIGKLIVFNKEIAKGSNGTIVLEGNYDGRLVAVKRLVRTHHDVAVKEIQNLIASDQHPNIVRWYGVEYDQDFIYLSLERCMCSLHELISLYASQEEITNRGHDHEFLSPVITNLQLLSNDGTDKAFELWKVNGYPSAGLLKLMRDVVCGLAHLHELGIIHRDLKPQNVLVLKDRSICAKISDMGISKLLDGDMSSLTKHATGSGSSGWQAPEQLRHERQTRAVDLFSLGCILFFCITGGKHPFGENLERDINIVNGRKDLFLIDNIPEATDLISQLLDSNPTLRPKAVEVLNHPLFWNSEMRLSFLRDVSDRVELEDRENASELLEALESRAKIALGGKWDERMDAAFLNDIGRYRRYKFDSVRDLLRVIRNKLNHFRELSKEIQVLLGPVPEGFDRYFSTRFPKLLIEVYRIILWYCADEEVFHKYFRSSHL